MITESLELATVIEGGLGREVFGFFAPVDACESKLFAVVQGGDAVRRKRGNRGEGSDMGYGNGDEVPINYSTTTTTIIHSCQPL